MITLLASAALAAQPLAPTVDRIAKDGRFAGEILIAKGDSILLHKAYGTVAPGGEEKHRVGAKWRLASITKQVTATQVLQAYDNDGELAKLDVPALGTLLPFLGKATLRQLLTHRTGLANPDNTPKGPDGVPQAYRSFASLLSHCATKPAVPGAPFAYNNCDYIIAGSFRARSWPAGMTMARGDEKGIPGFVAGKPEPYFRLSSYHTAGGLIGTARAVFNFDRQLMTGKLLKPAALAELWKPEGNGSYQALGQWVFPGKLKGCTAPVRIVQRDGEIQGVQARNFILPDHDIVVIAFTNRSSEDFAMGEVWQGKGFAHDLLAAAACPSSAAPN